MVLDLPLFPPLKRSIEAVLSKDPSSHLLISQKVIGSIFFTEFFFPRVFRILKGFSLLMVSTGFCKDLKERPEQHFRVLDSPVHRKLLFPFRLYALLGKVQKGHAVMAWTYAFAFNHLLVLHEEPETHFSKATSMCVHIKWGGKTESWLE